MEWTFTKLHACGNDFVVTDAPVRLSAALVRQICHRRHGVGADGLILLQAGPRGGAWRARIHNADGSKAAFSGNGLRCAGLFLARTGAGGGPFEIRTSGGAYRVGLERPKAPVVWLEAPLGARRTTWRPEPPPADLPATWTRHLLGIFRVVLGNTHWIFVSRGQPPNVRARLEGWARASKAFPSGVNVSWVRLASRARIALTTWERGAGATSACASATLAAAWVAAAHGWIAGTVTAEHAGGSLEVTAGRDAVSVRGACEAVYEGRLLIGMGGLG